MRIGIPDRIEFEIAVIGGITSRATGAVAFALDDRYAQFNMPRPEGNGVMPTR